MRPRTPQVGKQCKVTDKKGNKTFMNGEVKIEIVQGQGILLNSRDAFEQKNKLAKEHQPVRERGHKTFTHTLEKVLPETKS